MSLISTKSIFSDSMDYPEKPIMVIETKIFGLLFYRKKVYKANSNSEITFPIDK
ncbi:hypothetical protein MHL31_04240 [Lutibacter sp. A80]|uniref:hypothetical protein n=1 Tax=Lutibacter sp. A80 TaxID=2918453 RepID=UPI001F06BB5E|nr:hypothetical protein [Lutibacter sp. A80]UMB61418.1 hypothetical protein MHL31_04240 [Lutibacter sp. A80]